MAKKKLYIRGSEGPRRRGLTLIEMMVSMVLTLLLIFALAQAFSTISTTISFNRSTIEMASQLRSTSLLLQRDLEGLTVPTLTWADPAAHSGYFEYVEGPDKDYSTGDVDTSFGDVDDVLMFTSRSKGAPFTGLVDVDGMFNLQVRESADAEIVWWMSSRDLDGSGGSLDDPLEYFVYRRVLLIRPDFNNSVSGNLPGWPKFYPVNATGLSNLRTALQDFYRSNDVSVRMRVDPVGTNIRVQMIANSLSDLANRENRFAHFPILIEDSPLRLVTVADFPTYPTFPFVLDRNRNSVTSLDRLRYTPTLTGTGRDGEDVILAKALAFDVKAYDPAAQVRAHPGEDGAWGAVAVDDDGNGNVDDSFEAGWADSDDETVTPGDRGFAAGVVIGSGAYVDLNYDSIYPGNTFGTRFSDTPHVRSGLSGRFSTSAPVFFQPLLATWDTWSLDYESDNVNQDSPLLPRPTLPLMPSTITDLVADEGFNGFDDDGLRGVDDPNERETSPPYNTPLRAIQVKLRIIETDNRLVRQTSVVINFIPE